MHRDQGHPNSTRTSLRFRGGRSSTLSTHTLMITAVIACLVTFVYCGSALGASTTIVWEVDNGWVAKDNPTWVTFPNAQNQAYGKAYSEFFFHPFRRDPPGAGSGAFKKPHLSSDDNGPTVVFERTDVYRATEDHDTTGRVRHKMKMKRGYKPPAIPGTNPRPFFSVTNRLKPTITAGANENPAKVSVKVTSYDPWSFGTAEQGAVFDRNDSGFDTYFSIRAGTAFQPPIDYGFPGADELLGTAVMGYTLRVAPGVLSDPDTFWSAPEGAIDLYSVRISADNTMNISVDLEFGQSTSQFALDFKDSMGNPFDPMDPQAVDLIIQQIIGAFTNGEVLVDLNDVFSVGFVPLGGLDSYTSGLYSTVELPGIEVPAPGFTTMLLLGGILASRRRRQICPAWRDQP